MKILALSDLKWNYQAKGIKRIYDINNLPDDDAFYRLRYYINIINAFDPDVILMCGDLTGDRSCGEGFHYAFLHLLLYCDKNNIKVLFISGDHDIDDNYNWVINKTKGLSNTFEISGKKVVINKVKFLGISYELTKSKTFLEKLIENNKNINILITHCETKRRINLFDFNSKIVITGHFDKLLTAINNTIFISLENDFMTNVAFFDFNVGNRYSYWIEHPFHKNLYTLELKAETLDNGDFVYLYDETNAFDFLDGGETNLNYISTEKIKGQNFARIVKTLIKIKKEDKLKRFKNNDLRDLVSKLITYDNRISKSMISNYLGRSF